MKIILSFGECVRISKAEFRLLMKEVPSWNRKQVSSDLDSYPVQWTEEGGNTFAMEFSDCVYVHRAYMALR